MWNNRFQLRVSLGILLSSFLVVGCASTHLKTVWKGSNAVKLRYNKILVFANIHSQDTAVRVKMESELVWRLEKLGYYAVSAYREYGSGGFTGLDPEAAFAKLCNEGMDAVLTVALIDSSKEEYRSPPLVPTYPSSYYYDRIWNYQRIEGSLPNGYFPKSGRYFLECVLFDIYSLEVQYVVKSTYQLEGSIDDVGSEYATRIINRMVKHRVLKK